MVESKTMLEEVIPLYLAYLSGGRIKGRTRLQKLVFLTQKAIKDEVDYDFQKGWYGPLSFRLGKIVDRLVNLGLLCETNRKTPSGNKVIEYHMMPKGQALVQFAIQKKILPQRIRTKVEEVDRDYGSKRFIELLKKVHEDYPEYIQKSPLIKL